MKKETIKFFELKKEKHPTFGYGYRYWFSRTNWVKNADALMYTFIALEKWAISMQECLKKEESL